MEILLLASLAGLMIFAERILPGRALLVPPLTVLTLACALYIGSLFGALFHTALLAYVGGLLALVYLPLRSTVAIVRRASVPCLFHCRASSTARLLVAQLVRSPIAAPLGIFAALFGLSWFVFGGTRLAGWDEFTWGLFTKVAVRYDDIVARPGTPGAEYPRLGSLIQYFFIQFGSSGRLDDEGAAILAQTTIFAAAAAVFLPIGPSGRIRFLAAPFVCMAFYFLVQGCVPLPVSSLYQDGFLGLCWAMTVITYFINRKSAALRSLAPTAITLFALVQIKPIGLLLALFTLFVVGVDSGTFRRTNYRLVVLRVGVLAIVVVGSHLSWSFAKALGGIESRGKTLDGLNPASLISSSGSTRSLATFALEEFQEETLDSFIDLSLYGGDPSAAGDAEAEGDWAERRRATDPSAFIAPFRPYLLLIGRVSAPLLLWVVAFVGFATALCLTQSSTEYSRAETGMLLGLLASLLVVYACVICILYLFVFGTRESVLLASVERYLGAAILGVFLVLFHLLIQAGHKAVLIGFIAASLALVPADAGLRWRQGLPQSPLQKENDELRSILAPVMQVLSADDGEGNVLLVGVDNFSEVRMRFYLFPAQVNMVKLSDGEPSWAQVDGPLGGGAELDLDLREGDHLIVWKYEDFWTLHGDAVKAAGVRSAWQVEGRELVVRF